MVDNRKLTPEQQKLVAANVKLAYRRVKELMRANRTLDFGDIIGTAFEGLCQAALRFEAKRGCQFSTYACQYIRGYTINTLRDTGDIIRTPRKSRKAIHQVCQHPKSTKSFDEWITPLNRTMEDVSQETLFSGEDIVAIAKKVCRPVEVAIIEHILSGGNQSGAAKLVGFTRSAASAAKMRAFEKIRKHIRQVTSVGG
jgi:RNA polymerase sigma factor (sigma-70 family)